MALVQRNQLVGDALVHDLINYISSKRIIGPRLGRAHRLNIGECCSLVAHMMGIASGVDIEDLRLESRIKNELINLAQSTDVAVDDIVAVEDGSVHALVIPTLIRHFLKVDDTCFSDAHWDTVLRAVVPTSERHRQSSCPCTDSRMCPCCWRLLGFPSPSGHLGLTITITSVA